ncbi:MAG: lipopolysaccharide transport periplasmic protein LptA [Steroidobacteraceae bacterium]
MAPTIRKPAQAAAALVGLALVGAAAVASVKPRRLVKPSGPISLDAKKTKLDARTHRILLTSVVITQGDLKVSADHAEATGLSFRNSRWSFTGHVHISSPLEGSIESDKATVEFGDGTIQDAIATGSPAQFEQTSSTTGVLARGHAESIVYTVALDTVRLAGNAWLDYGGNKISSPVLTYDIATQQLQGASAAGQEGRVHITIQPKAKAKAKGRAP